METTRHSTDEGWALEFRRGLRQLAAGEFDSAERHFTRAHQWAPERPDVCYALGRERLRKGDVAAAEPLLRRAWSADPTLLSCGAALARCVGLYRGDFPEAHKILNEAALLHPESPTVDVVRAELYVEAGCAQAAMSCARAVLAMEHASATSTEAARIALARALNLDGADLARGGQLDQALFAFKSAANLNPEWSAPIVNTGAALAQLGNRKRALGHYRRALVLDPENSTARANAGRLHLDMGNVGAAVSELSLAVDIDPTDDRTWLDLSTAYERAGDHANALHSLQCAIDLNPAHATACKPKHRGPDGSNNP